MASTALRSKHTLEYKNKYSYLYLDLFLFSLLLYSYRGLAASAFFTSTSKLSFLSPSERCDDKVTKKNVVGLTTRVFLLDATKRRHHQLRQSKTSSSSSSSSSNSNSIHSSNEHTQTATCCDCDGEVVGHTGRIGSFLLRANVNCVPVPRRDSQPGSLSPIGTPIFVSVPATQVTSVINATIPDRRQDLVFITNGIPSDFINHFNALGDNNDDDGKDKDPNISSITTSVPHFGVLKVGQDPISDQSLSPPTVIHGKHAKRLKTLLESYGINSKIVSSTMDIDAAATRKLLWVSSMWLLCHDTTTVPLSSSSSPSSSSPPLTSPIDVTQVHQLKQLELFELVQYELYPAALALLERYHNISHTDAINVMGTLEEVMSYLKSYSFSMPGACPNKQLAIEEIGQRNHILLSTSIAQPRHKTLIDKVVK